MRITRVYADADGESHFAEVDIPLADGGPIGRMSERLPAHGVIFRETEPGYDRGPVNAPRARRGREIELTVSDGETRRFACGDVLLVEDTTGKGHRTRHTRPERRRSLFIPLDPEDPSP